MLKDFPYHCNNPQLSTNRYRTHRQAKQQRNDESVSDGSGLSFLTADTLPINSSNRLADIISHRVSFLKATLGDINAEIQSRHQVTQVLNTDIDDKLCHVLTEIDNLGLWYPQTRDNRRLSLEKQVADLYIEQRHQQLTHWQDTATLKREKRAAEKELHTATLDLWLLQFLSSK